MSWLGLSIVVLVALSVLGAILLIRKSRSKPTFILRSPVRGQSPRAIISGVDPDHIADALKTVAAQLDLDGGPAADGQVKIQVQNLVVNRDGSTISVRGGPDELMKVLLDAGVPIETAKQAVVVSSTAAFDNSPDSAGEKGPTSDPSSEQLVAELELLHSQGMIDDDEYRRRRAELLKGSP